MQRLFTTFPGGWPGLGMLVLRLAVSAHALAAGAAFLLWPGAPAWLLGVLLVLAGAALLVGFLTPVAGCALALSSLAALAQWLPLLAGLPPPPRQAAVDLLTMAVAVACLGPGAFSLDALLFGRREIIIRDGPGSIRD